MLKLAESILNRFCINSELFRKNCSVVIGHHATAFVCIVDSEWHCHCSLTFWFWRQLAFVPSFQMTMADYIVVAWYLISVQMSQVGLSQHSRCPLSCITYYIDILLHKWLSLISTCECLWILSRQYKTPIFTRRLLINNGCVLYCPQVSWSELCNMLFVGAMRLHHKQLYGTGNRCGRKTQIRHWVIKRFFSFLVFPYYIR